jgi:hypothetical protein
MGIIMTNKELIKLFKKSVEDVCKVLKIEPYLLKRDDYYTTAIANDIPRLNKTQLNDLGGFKVAKECYFPMSAKAIKQQQQENEKATVAERCAHISKCYAEYIQTNGFTPSYSALQKQYNIEIKDINKYFGSLKLLHEDSLATYNFQDSLLNETHLTTKAWDKLKKTVKNHKKFVITTVVSGKEVDIDCLNSIKTYLDKNNAALLLLPCQDTSSRDVNYAWQFDPELREFDIVWKDMYLNSNFYLNSILVSAKQIQPLTGLDRLAQAKGSMALASPKQYLEYVANSNEQMPRALMTTGAITLPDYETEQR